MLPETEDFRRRVDDLLHHPHLVGVTRGEDVFLRELELDQIVEIDRLEEGRYFLLAAAGLNRTSLRTAMREAEVSVVSQGLRRAFAIRTRLPVREGFRSIAGRAVALRSVDLGRRARGEVERLFRDRLASEGIPILMSPPVRTVPGILIGRRKPDGVFPDPATGQSPLLYLEIKNVRRVSDDIQKRLYELAEASLEMKLIYGGLQLKGADIRSTLHVDDNLELRDGIRRQIQSSHPVVVGMFLCSRDQADRYRLGAEVFVDRIFFQEEIDECLSFLRDVIESDPG